MPSLAPRNQSRLLVSYDYQQQLQYLLMLHFLRCSFPLTSIYFSQPFNVQFVCLSTFLWEVNVSVCCTSLLLGMCHAKMAKFETGGVVISSPCFLFRITVFLFMPAREMFHRIRFSFILLYFLPTEIEKHCQAYNRRKKNTSGQIFNLIEEYCGFYKHSKVLITDILRKG